MHDARDLAGIRRETDIPDRLTGDIAKRKQTRWKHTVRGVAFGKIDEESVASEKSEEAHRDSRGASKIRQERGSVNPNAGCVYEKCNLRGGFTRGDEKERDRSLNEKGTADGGARERKKEGSRGEEGGDERKEEEGQEEVWEEERERGKLKTHPRLRRKMPRGEKEGWPNDRRDTLVLSGGTYQVDKNLASLVPGPNFPKFRLTFPADRISPDARSDCSANPVFEKTKETSFSATAGSRTISSGVLLRRLAGGVEVMVMMMLLEQRRQILTFRVVHSALAFYQRDQTGWACVGVCVLCIKYILCL
ncbi:hypothetical protein WN51_04263 [Melipona quadrifasciata]|uniref:Uncharacterized protein n=1 Tax=Melipona quadrifasciata TaxID=166423 RepID=A0A0N0U3M0_9HYME|nr:hypothetical protein WN51_04263 [Melipona quadrifasciata]